MKIGHSDPHAPANSVERGVERSDVAKAKSRGIEPASGDEAGATLDLSISAAAQAAAGAAPEFDAAKVERIAQAIREGRFEINADAIADKLIANARDLLARGKC